MEHFVQHHKDNKDDFNFSNINFPLLDINILTAIAMYFLFRNFMCEYTNICIYNNLVPLLCAQPV